MEDARKRPSCLEGRRGPPGHRGAMPPTCLASYLAGMGADLGALAPLFLKAERKNQVRFKPWINWSVCTMVVEMSVTKFVFICTCQLRLLVKSERCCKVWSRAVATMVRLVSVLSRVAWAD